jgi:hypothetical protein
MGYMSKVASKRRKPKSASAISQFHSVLILLTRAQAAGIVTLNRFKSASDQAHPSRQTRQYERLQAQG